MQLFFDDEARNRDVETLGALQPLLNLDVPNLHPAESYASHSLSEGVTFILVDRGMNRKTFEKGLTEWRRRHPPAFEDRDNDVE